MIAISFAFSLNIYSESTNFYLNNSSFSNNDIIVNSHYIFNEDVKNAVGESINNYSNLFFKFKNNNSFLNEGDLVFLNNVGGVSKGIPIYSFNQKTNLDDILAIDSKNLDDLGIKMDEGNVFNNANNNANNININNNTNNNTNNNSEMIISKSYQKNFNLAIGDKINISDKNNESHEFNIVGIFKDDLNFKNSLITSPSSLSKLNNSDHPVILSFIILKLKNNSLSQVKQVKQILIESNYSFYSYDNSYAYISSYNLNEGIDLFIINDFFNFLSISSWILGVFMILFVELSLVNNRITELSILKSVGWKNKNIILMMILENILFLIILTFVSIAFTYFFLNFWIVHELNFIPVYTMASIVKTFTFVLIIGLFAVIFSVYRFINFSIVDALKFN